MIEGAAGLSHWMTNPVEKIKDPILPKFGTEEKGTLVYGNFRITPEDNKISITFETQSDNDIDLFYVGMVKGFKGLKGITRAKREIVYLESEPDELNKRILSGKYPVISPDGIMTGYEVRPEVPLIPEPVQVRDPVKPDIWEEIAIMRAELERVELVPGMGVPEYDYHELIRKEFLQEQYPIYDILDYFDSDNQEILNRDMLVEHIKANTPALLPAPVIVPLLAPVKAPKLPVKNICHMWTFASKTLTMSSGVAL
jgi:hypothetical protein